MLYWSQYKSLSQVRETKAVNNGKIGDGHALTLVCSLLEVAWFVLTRIVLKNIMK